VNRIKTYLLIILLSTGNSLISQITFTQNEVRQLAEQNIERKQCLELNVVLNDEIDTLHYTLGLFRTQVTLKDSIITNYNGLIKNYEGINAIRQIQIEEAVNRNSDNEVTIKKQNRRLNFWRIFTPITISATVVISLFL